MQEVKRNHVQELELAYSKLKDEMEQLLDEKLQNGSGAINFRSFVEKILEENDR